MRNAGGLRAINAAVATIHGPIIAGVVSKARNITPLFRFVVTAISVVSTLFLVNVVGGAILLNWHVPVWPSLVSWPLAIVVGRYAWRNAPLQTGLISSIVLGAFLTGGIGFAGGFFGPIIFMPSANQGPLLGIFITGPLGVIVGAVGGAIYWLGWGRRQGTGTS